MAALPFSFPRNTNNIKLEKFCRLCLSRETVLQSIFDVHFGVTSLDYVITTLTGVKIDERDGLPTSVCNSCTDKASIAYDLKKLVLESQALLQDIVKKEKSENFYYNHALQNEILKVKEEQACSFNDFDDYAELSLDDFNDADHIKVEIDAVCKSSATSNQLQCHICLRQLESELGLITHLKTCSTSFTAPDAGVGSGSYCPLCGTCYDTSANLTKHMWQKHADLMGPKKRGRPKNVHTSTLINRLSVNGICIKSVNLKKRPCAFCKKQFKNKEALKEHIASHKDSKLYTCLMCKRMYLKLSKFKAHPCLQTQDIKSEMQEDATSGATKENDKDTFLADDTLRSVLEHTTVPQVCHYCSEVLGVSVDMSSHIDSQHPEHSKRCNICTKLFSSVKSAARHRTSCVKIERKYVCSCCGLKFPFEISLNKHILRYHEGESVSTNFIDPALKQLEKKFQCDTCKKLFARKESLAVHTKLHMITKTFQCDVCNREFNRKDNMKQHRRTHEARVVKRQTSLCLYCGRSFNNSSNLIVHMRRHTGEKPYKCDFCGKGFPRSSDLQVHRRSHTGEKPCQCKVCGKAFSRSNKLTRHMRVHTGLKPYKCTYCEKAFAQSNDLTLHIRRHTGDKPYICEVCGDRFIQGTALQNHRRAHGHFPATAPQHPMFHQGLVQTSRSSANILLKLPMCGPALYPPCQAAGLPAPHATPPLLPPAARLHE